MNGASDGLLDRLRLARELADAAGELSLRYFRRASLGVDTKGDGSPVTVADREAEQMIRRAVADAFGADGVIGEEFGTTEGTSGYRWVIDPIDGTISFVRGVPLYGTMIGIERDGEPVAGVIHMPGLGETVFGAKGHGAWYVCGKSEPLRAGVARSAKLGEAMVNTTSIDYFVKGGVGAMYSRLHAASGGFRGWSDCYGFVLLVSGRVDAVVEPLMKHWDGAAAAPIVEEAGGVYTDFGGVRGVLGGSAVAAAPDLHREILRITRTS